METKEKVIYGVIFSIVLYMNIAWFIFAWRNPLCNEIAFFKHFVSVMSFEKLDKYQP